MYIECSIYVQSETKNSKTLNSLREHQKQTSEMLDDHHWEIRENQQIQGLGLHNGLSGWSPSGNET